MHNTHFWMVFYRLNYLLENIPCLFFLQPTTPTFYIIFQVATVQKFLQQQFLLFSWSRDAQQFDYVLWVDHAKYFFFITFVFFWISLL